MYLQPWYVKNETFGHPLVPCSACVGAQLDAILQCAVYALGLRNFLQISVVVCTA